MNSLSSFFELIGGLNAAFIVSNHFIKSIYDRVSAQYSTVEDKLKTGESLIDEASKYLIEQVDDISIKGENAKKVASDLNDKLKELKKKREALKVSVSLEIEKSCRVANFSYLCLYGTLYAFLFLILFGFNFNFSLPSSKLALLVFNLGSILFLYILFKDNKKWFKWFKSGYYAIISTFFVLTLIVVFIFLLRGENCLCNYDYDWFNTIFCIAIPSGHFSYYFFVTIFNAKKSSSKFLIEIDSLIQEIQTYNHELKITIKTTNLLLTEPNIDSKEG